MRVRFLQGPWPDIAILVLALALRVWLIEIKPPHFDEGINGWFVDQMTATGYYRYDPTNYHGPLHFYALFLTQSLFGRELWALRLPAILASIAAVWALLRFREFFGTGVSRFAALAMSVSPACVFYGRYSIHESWQVLFSILAMGGFLGLWQFGSRRAFFTLAVGITGLILTKETYVLHLGCMVLAIPVLWLYQIFVPSRPAWPVAKQQWSASHVLVALGTACLAIVFFYSGTFHDFSMLAGLVKTFEAWFATGLQTGGHEKPTFDLAGPLNWYWIALLLRYEWPALLGLAACVRYMAPSDARLRYVAIAAAGVLLAYSIIPYKTPWCIISMVWPFYLVLGGLLKELAGRFRQGIVWSFPVPVLAGSLAICLGLNFRNFTDDREPYVYVQTYKDVDWLVEPLLESLRRDPSLAGMTGVISLDSYYPLPWMLGEFTRVGYYPKDAPPARWDADFLVIDSSRASDIEPQLGRPYHKIPFRLRSGQEECTAYLASPLFDEILQRAPNFQPGAER